LIARAVSICDAFDALTSTRPYRLRGSKQLALETLKSGAGSQFDPDLLACFIDYTQKGC
jgi:putative two-component system response regulator